MPQRHTAVTRNLLALQVETKPKYKRLNSTAADLSHREIYNATSRGLISWILNPASVDHAFTTHTCRLPRSARPLLLYQPRAGLV